MKQKSILHSLLFPFWAVGILKLETILLDPFVDWAKGLSFPLLTAVLCLLAKILCLAIPVAFLESEQECRLKLRFPPPSFWKGGWIAVFIPMSILGIAIPLAFRGFRISLMKDAFVAPNSLFAGVVMLLWAVVLPAILEEWLFRREILFWLRPYGRAKAILFSALLFGVVHASFPQMLSASVGGLFLGVAALRWGVGASMFLHGMYNLLNLLILWIW